MSRKKFLYSLVVGLGLCISSTAAERPTFNKNTCDPRPDILPYCISDCAIGEYRRAYNRPRYIPGWLAHTFEPSSQEALVWCEANRVGLYAKPHQPPMCKSYYFPKPWEILDTGPRPDFARSSSLSGSGETVKETTVAKSDVKPTAAEPGKVSEAQELSP